jgi:TonB-linked SusC/RagA family outer membrane protein
MEYNQKIMKQLSNYGIVLLFGALLLSPLSIWAQEQVSGTVTDENGAPLPGTTVVVEETNQGTTTDFDGNYQINAAQGQTIVFSYVGYESQSMAVGTSSSINMQLKAANELEEVVLTGVAGKTDLKKVSFAVGKVNEDEIQQAPGVNPANAIRSKVPGVTVVQGSGLPGNASAIRIRGATSLIGSQAPLIILEGIILEGTLADINSEDIESMEILKGSAASSLYGSRAANGVIQIFTKRGSSSLGTDIKIRSEYGVSYIPKTRLPSIAQHHNYQLDSDGQFLLDEEGGLQLEDDKIIDNDFPNYFDSVNQFYKSNDFHSQYISITNRSEGSNSLISFQNLEQEGILSLDFYGYNRQNFRLNHDIKISDKFRISSSNLVSASEGIEPTLGSGSPFYSLLFTPPHANLHEKNSEDGSEYNWDAQSEANWPTTETNPLYTLNNLNLTRNRERFVSNLKLSYLITDYLELETYYSIDYENSRFSQFVDTDWLDEENSTFLNGYIFQTRFNSRADNISATLAFDKYVNDNLNLKIKVNYFHENRNTSSINASGTELGITGLNTLDNVISGSENIGSSRFNIVANSFSIISAFDYKDRYLIDFLVRNDGVSLFGPNVRNQNFYRFSAAYRISEDLNLNGIDEWKIRGSFGTSGLRPPFSAQYETYNVSQGTATKSTIGNDDLGPYFSTELEVGTNLSFLNIFDFELNYATKSTNGQVLPVDIPVELGGFASQWQNAGTLESSTYEALLRADIINKNNLSWDISFLFSSTDQTITELARPEFQIGPNNAFLIKEGEPFGIFYGHKVLDNLADLPAGTDLSTYRINDDGYVVNEDHEPQFLLDENGNKSQVVIGDINPDFNLSISSTLNLKKFSAYLLFDIKKGGDVYNQTKQWTYRELLHPEVDQTGKPEAEKIPAGYYSGLYNINNTTSHFVEDGSYFKFRELNLSYNLTQDLMGETSFVKNIKFSLIGRNLITISNYSGVDPEVTVLGNGDQTNFMFDGFGYPNFTTVTGGIEINF